jgi:hypothetical protein
VIIKINITQPASSDRLLEVTLEPDIYDKRYFVAQTNKTKGDIEVKFQYNHGTNIIFHTLHI